MLALTYLLYMLTKEVINKKISLKIKNILKRILRILSVIVLVGSIGYSIYLDVLYLQSKEKHTDIEHFKHLKMQDELYLSIKQLDEFILEMEKYNQTVYILDKMSPMCMIPINKYNKDYDMFNIGNFGGKGEEGIIEDIKQKENLVLLIEFESREKNWQHPKKITDYVKENLEEIGKINIYDVYFK